MTVSQSGNNIVISGSLSALNSFAWNGSALTADDVAEAASVGLGAGHIIFWGRADSLALTPKTITIGKDGYEDAVITVSFVEG